MALKQNNLISVYEDSDSELPELSDAYKYATAEGGIGLDAYYGNINKFLASNPDEKAIADAMAQYKVSQADVDYAKSLLNNSSAASTTNLNTVADTGTTGALSQANAAVTNNLNNQSADNLVVDNTSTAGALTQATSGLTDNTAAQKPVYTTADFLSQSSANNASASQATEAGLKMLYDAGYSPEDAAALWNSAYGTNSVSYTHLTLPTILRV